MSRRKRGEIYPLDMLTHLPAWFRVYTIFDMSTENEQSQEQDVKILSLFLNLLSSMKSMDAKLFENLHAFFVDKFVLLSDHEWFDEPSYREEFVEHLEYLRNLSLSFKDYSPEEIRLAFDTTRLILTDHREKVTGAAKELAHA